MKCRNMEQLSRVTGLKMVAPGFETRQSGSRVHCARLYFIGPVAGENGCLWQYQPLNHKCRERICSIAFVHSPTGDYGQF
jgi:hypothetical protein